MMPNAPRPAAADLCETYRQHSALGNETIEGPGCYVVRNDAAPEVYDANFLQVGAQAEWESALAFHDAHLGARSVRHFRTDPQSAPEFPAELALRDYTRDPTLQLLLDGELAGPAPGDFEMRPVESDSDWSALGNLFRADHIETDSKRGTQIFSESLTRQIVGVHRSLGLDPTFFMVWVDDEAVAFFSAWPGTNGVGMVEDLFTQPSHRQRGIARALIHHCVGDARSRGAERVLIGAEIDGTPKHIYAALGFRPTCLTQSWVQSRAGARSGASR